MGCNSFGEFFKKFYQLRSKFLCNTQKSYLIPCVLIRAWASIRDTRVYLLKIIINTMKNMIKAIVNIISVNSILKPSLSKTSKWKNEWYQLLHGSNCLDMFVRQDPMFKGAAKFKILGGPITTTKNKNHYRRITTLKK